MKAPIETSSRNAWLIHIAFGVVGYALLMFVATGQLGILAFFELQSRGDWDAAGASLVSIMLFYGGGVYSYKESKARCLCLCAACRIFLVQAAWTHWHPIVILPLVCYSLATIFLVLTWLDTGSLDS